MGKDKILRREEKITSMEKEIKRLENSLENQKKKEENLRKKFSDAWSSKQESDVKVKELLSRIESMQAKIDEISREEPRKERRQVSSRHFKFSEFKNLLEKISTIGSVKQVLISAYISPTKKEYIANLEELLGDEDMKAWESIESDTGKVLFYDLEGLVRVVIVPFLPLVAPKWERKQVFDIGPLRDLMETERRLGIIIARAGQSMVGITSSPEKFEIMNEVKTRVARDHSRGGFSQRRFERLREKDIDYHMDKLKEASSEIISGIDFLLLSGDFRLTRELEEELRVPIVKISSDIPANKKNQYKILEMIWGTRVYYL